MFIIDLDDTLFDTHFIKNILTKKSPDDLLEAELKELLYPDAPSFLQYLKNIKQKLILLSLGDFSFQSKKINAAGIASFFDEIIITADAKESALEKFLEQFNEEEDVWFVNDKIEETKKILQHFPKIKPLLKKSPRFTHEEYCSSQLPCFETLIQIQKYVEQQIK